MIKMHSNAPWQILLVVFALTAVQRLEARIWTSRSGASIEAELSDVERGFAVLESAEGKRFKIRIADLSQEDQLHIEQSKGSESEVRQLTKAEIAAQFGVSSEGDKGVDEEANGGVDEARPRDEQMAEKLKLHFLDSSNFAAPAPFKVEEFSNLDLKHPAEAAFLGLQYGPGAKDVVYIAFDRETSTALPETAFVHNLGKTRMNVPSYKRKGKKSDFEKEEGKEEYDIVRFEDIELQSSFGDVKLKAEVQFVFGILNVHIVHAIAAVELQKNFEKCNFIVAMDVTQSLSGSSGEIKTLRLLGPPNLDVKVLWNNIYGKLNLGDWTMLPGRGMEDKVELVIEDMDGKGVEDADVEWEEAEILGNSRDEWKWHSPEKMKEKPGQYKVRARIDLGPFFGALSDQTTHTVNK